MLRIPFIEHVSNGASSARRKDLTGPFDHYVRCVQCNRRRLLNSSFTGFVIPVPFILYEVFERFPDTQWDMAKSALIPEVKRRFRPGHLMSS